MNVFDVNYLRENGFHHIGGFSNEYRSYVKKDGQQAEFSNRRQLGFIHLQFEEIWDNIETMFISVIDHSADEWKVTLTWDMKNCVKTFESNITGTGLYETISESIVLAEVTIIGRSQDY